MPGAVLPLFFSTLALQQQVWISESAESAQTLTKIDSAPGYS